MTKAEALKAMEEIWDKIPKGKDGLTISYNNADVDYLYYYGFVDTRRHAVEAWRNAFKAFASNDGWFVLNKEQFLSLTPFRYTGLANRIFDPMTMRDGSWTTAELDELYKYAFEPSSDIKEKAFWAFVKSLKESGHVDGGGNLAVTEAVKVGFVSLIERFPSPRRRLEKEVQRLSKEREAKLAGNSVNRDLSGFGVGKTAKENTLDAYEKLKATSPASPAQATVASKQDEGIDIKKLRRPSPKMRG